MAAVSEHIRLNQYSCDQLTDEGFKLKRDNMIKLVTAIVYVVLAILILLPFLIDGFIFQYSPIGSFILFVLKHNLGTGAAFGTYFGCILGAVALGAVGSVIGKTVKEVLTLEEAPRYIKAEHLP